MTFDFHSSEPSVPPLPVLRCPACRAHGVRGLRVCAVCRGMGAGITFGDEWLSLTWPLSVYHATLRRVRRTVYRIETTAAFAFAVGFLLAAFVLATHTFTSWSVFPLARDPQLFLLAAVLIFAYAWHTILRDRDGRIGIIPPTLRSQGTTDNTMHMDDWQGVRRFPRRKQWEISDYFEPTVRRSLDRAMQLAAARGDHEVGAEHLFVALLQSSGVASVIVRLGIPFSAFTEAILPTRAVRGESQDPSVKDDVLQILFRAFFLALKEKHGTISDVDVFAALLEVASQLEPILFTLGIDRTTMRRVVAWARVAEGLRLAQERVAHGASLMSDHGMDRAMTATATPRLNALSVDVTNQEKHGMLPPVVGRESVIEEALRLIESGQTHMVFSGDDGTGKMSIIHALVARIVAGDVPRALQEKRVVQLSVSALLSGTTTTGAIERLRTVLSEAGRAGNIVLVIDHIHDLLGMIEPGVGIDPAAALLESLNRFHIPLFATTTTEGYGTVIVRSALGSALSHIALPPLEDEEVLQIIEAHVGYTEYQHQVVFSYQALTQIALLAKRFLRDAPLPESALRLLDEVATYVQAKGKGTQVVRSEDVSVLVQKKTGIPIETVSAKESETLFALETAMHHDVVGQNEAVSLVAAALRRARVNLHMSRRPIATLLFLGPTGVGKTELAKTIARVYFGGEERMIRFDMSEFQDDTSIARLIGEPGKPGTGLLTEAVRTHPFSLVLFDELEKANPNVLNLFLQVFDDGRLTDSVGRVIDFTSTMIIATSNAGTAYASNALAEGQTLASVREALVHRELISVYRPEFLNRFDAIVLFRPLAFDDAVAITHVLLRSVVASLHERGIAVRLQNDGVATLAKAGFDPVFGARPIRRVIQDTVENTIADLLLTNRLRQGDTLVLDASGALRVESSRV